MFGLRLAFNLWVRQWIGRNVDVTVTATAVLPGTGVLYHDAILGETVTAGQVCYILAATSAAWLADADASAAAATIKGVAMNGGAAGQVVRLAVGGEIDPGFTVTVGQTYVASGTAGGIAPIADLASSDYVSHLGWGKSASILKLDINNTAVQVP